MNPKSVLFVTKFGGTHQTKTDMESTTISGGCLQEKIKLITEEGILKVRFIK